YLMKRAALFDLLEQDSRADFGKHLIGTEMQKGTVHSYLYGGYWEDIGTIESYYRANLAMTRPCMDRKLGLDCYDESSLIITKSHDLPGAQISHCTMENTLLCEGSVIRANLLRNSVVGVRTIIGEGSVVEDSILLGNEYYQRPPREAGEAIYAPSIGENCLIKKAIIDENVLIGNNVHLVNQAGHVEYESPDGKIFVKDGIMIIPRNTHIPSNYRF
ncbi:MAG: glucose-1-phosphate adenylyltransferase, partial [Chlamydiae bacterium]|nr:glucose-1-phosphate adenylyltransferase [Chlamydiota bacterium]